MDKLLGILPYIYLEEPVKLGNVTFLGLPDWQGRDHAPAADPDKRYLREFSACFPTTRGLSTDKGGVKAITYFLLNTERGKEAQTLQEARDAVSLLRYSMLRPDTQAVDDIESAYIYAFVLPPAGSDNYPLYRCWPNLNAEQELWVSPKDERFPPPGWYVDLQLIHTSQLEDIDEIKQCFYGQGMIGEREETILAIEWYNQSFLKYTLRGVAGRLVDVATAFETLLQLPKHNKTAEFRKRIREYLGAEEDSLLDKWACKFYSDVRSETVHKGKPLSYWFQHPQAQTPHLSFLWSARRVFRECISAKTGLPRHIDNDRLIEALTPNEVHPSKLKAAGSFEKILEYNLLREVEKLRQIYPLGRREDIIWLGKELLRGYKAQYKLNQQYLPTLQVILDTDDTGSDLGLQYFRFLEEFRRTYPESYIAVGQTKVSEDVTRKVKPITRANVKQFQLESAIYNFARFAGWALLLPP